ncbi:hypothetical protein IP81_01590 [Novosphingobium sp. AAP83]|nr:hypothetical protein IP81_01590 [Novosphingobium sp. AAP83]
MKAQPLTTLGSGSPKSFAAHITHILVGDCGQQNFARLPEFFRAAQQERKPQQRRMAVQQDKPFGQTSSTT